MRHLKSRLLAGFSAFAMAMSVAPGAMALTVRDDVTVPGSEARADDEQYDGVIQIYMITPSGGIFFNCSGTLINPRTAITAAHCFNDLPSDAYGLGPGQYTPIIAYGPDTFDALFTWLDFGITQIDARNGLTFGNQVIIHPDADPAFGAPFAFPGADVALVSLDDPLAHLPTYSMLFSQVPVGTHVQMVGYGSHGTGLTGDIGIDGKRQAGENILGLVGSQADFFRGAFGNDLTYFSDIPSNQLLYYTDFDRPDRDTSVCSRENDYFGFFGLVCSDPAKPINGLFGLDNDVVVVTDDIDWFPGDALPYESGTAGGDSGSALFADDILEGQLLITGVLSGGFNFTAPQPSGYGDVSYYNPLFLFYDFIAEANPYKYVAAVEGDGVWSDGEHWVQLLDPAYLIIDAEGNVINGLPDAPEPGAGGSDPREGVVFDTDITDVIPGGAAPTGGNAYAVSAVATQQLTTLDGGAMGLTGSIDTKVEVPELITTLYGDIGSPGPWTGPGATGAVPSNGVNANGFINYFDVTLNAAGTTTADIDVTVDKLTLDNTAATLAIAEDVVFISLVDTQIAAGTLDVTGIFASRDILNGGTVRGSGGFIVADTLFNLGLLDAGTGLELYGDLVLTSAGGLNPGETGVTVNGDVALGGLVVLDDYAAGQSGTLLAYSGEAVGEFALGNFNNNQGVRRLNISEAMLEGYTALNYAITVEQYTDFLGASGLDPNSLAAASLLDANRGAGIAGLDVLYNSFDFLSAADLVTPISRLSPDTAFQAPALSSLAGSTLPQHLDRRMAGLRAGTAGSQAFRSGASAMQLASLDDRAMAGLISQAEAETDTGGDGSAETAASRGYGVFGEVSVSNGSQEAGISGAEADIEGISLTIGVDAEVVDGVSLGVFGNYSDGSSDFNSGLGTSDGEGYLIGVYGTTSRLGFADASGYAGFGSRDFDTVRTGAFGPLTGETEADEVVAGLALSKAVVMDAATGFTAVPELRVDYQSYDVGAYEEMGDVTAMYIGGREFSTLQVKAGGDLHLYDPEGEGMFRPSVGARIVYDLDGERDAASASFVAGGAETTIVGASRDKAWGELRGALNFGQEGGRFHAALFAEGTVDRQDLSYLTLGLTLRSNF